MIRVTLAQAQHFILQKNYLTIEKVPDINTCIDRLVGLPADPHTTPFLSLLVRLTNFSPDLLLTELNQQRTLVRSKLMCHTDYIVPADSFITWHAATTRQRAQGLNAEFRLWGIESNDEIERLAEIVLNMLDTQPTSIEAIIDQLPGDLVQTLTQTSRGGRVTETTNVALALRWLMGQGQVGVIGSTTDWRDESLRYARLTQLYPDLDLTNAPTEAEAQKALVRAYLAAFGPVTEPDISFWTGFGKSETRRAISALSSETIMTMVEGIPGMLLTLKSQADALKAVQTSPDPIINILPADDPYTTAHRASRARYFADPSLQRRIFKSSGAAKSTILLDGQIIGTWMWQNDDDQPQLQWQLFSPVDSALQSKIEAELEQVAAFIDPQTVVNSRD